MGNGVGKLNLCFAGDAGEISRRRHHDIAVHLTSPLDEGLGHSFCYIRPEAKLHSSTTSAPADHQAPFMAISGASISANTTTPLSTDTCQLDATANKASAAFESSQFFSSIPLQPIPKHSSSNATSVRSGPVSHSGPGPGPNSGPIERLFLSGPIERSFISGPLENSQFDQFQRYRPKSKKWSLVRNLRKVLKSKSMLPWGGGNSREFTGSNTNSTNITSNNSLSSQVSVLTDEYDENNDSFGSQKNVQWAQGKAGEDRVHVVISEEHGWVFVGIYDGFNGPDATDFLLNNLYTNVYKELKGLLWNDPSSSCENTVSSLEFLEEENVDHSLVLKALSDALRKTEGAYLEVADMMAGENPELALMGSCVLAMLMKGDDVYLMNVGDSRAVLAQKDEVGKVKKELERINEESLVDGFDEFGYVHNLSSHQITMDHSTCVKEEIQRIKIEHPDDPSAIMNDRVKGSLKVTRAFGAGFLKQPKWNNALLEMFRIKYVGTSPYITCSPSLYHHRLSPRDKFLILSSDGLYQYFTNQEAVSEVEMFMSLFPEGDPAQHLVEEVLFRAAKKAGMNFHELLDIPQGERRRYHDDVSIIIISLEGRIWRSSV